jgi:hypothetical protein
MYCSSALDFGVWTGGAAIKPWKTLGVQMPLMLDEDVLVPSYPPMAALEKAQNTMTQWIALCRGPPIFVRDIFSLTEHHW